MTALQLDDRELATVLAALRFWQRQGHSMYPEHEIATNAGTHSALMKCEIDALCERINVTTDPHRWVQVPRSVLTELSREEDGGWSPAARTALHKLENIADNMQPKG